MYWFRPGWYGDIQVWTGADPEWGKAEVITIKMQGYMLATVR